MKRDIFDILESNPVIAAVREVQQVEKAVESNVGVVFILSGDLLNIKNIVETVKRRGKKVFVHIDLIEGLGKDRPAIDFIEKYAKPDGYITTKASLAKYAKQQGLFTILRLFIIDSHSLITGIKNINDNEVDAIEVMPGVASKIIERLKQQVNVPVIAGGLIETKDDIIDSLSTGILAVSTSREELWNM